MFPVTICSIDEMLSADPNMCCCCGKGPVSPQSGGVVWFEGHQVRVLASMQVPTCDVCRAAYPGPVTRIALLAQIENDLIGYDGSGRPVLRGC
jgi:hypothetical protein